MTFIWYPKCSTCQKAKKWLDEKVKLLSSDGMLIKRPLIIGDKIIPGFKNYDSLK